VDGVASSVELCAHKLAERVLMLSQTASFENRWINFFMHALSFVRGPSRRGVQAVLGFLTVYTWGSIQSSWNHS
jgi:hypothetical protein